MKKVLYDVDYNVLTPNSQTQYFLYTVPVRITIASKINHDVSFSIHDAAEGEWRDVTPHFEGSEEGIAYDFLIQIRSVAQDSEESAG